MAKSRSSNKVSRAKSAPKGREKITPKAPAGPRDGSYTFNLVCSFELQYTFSESEVELDSGSDSEKDFCPTDAALQALAREMTEVLGQNWPVCSFEAHADSDSLLRVVEEP